MTVSMTQLSAASAGPPMTKYDSPNFLSVGNSLMWGQGLRPEHRFREMVRSRIEQEKGKVIELSMARSGAVMEPQVSTDEKGELKGPDKVLQDGMIASENKPLEPYYSPENYAREMPNSAMSIQWQLSTAREIIDQFWGTQAYKNVNWILLDGGINDVGVKNIIPAGLDGFDFSCRSNWLIDEGKRVEKLMVDTLKTALEKFPSATTVVNGYFPIFSLFSIGSITKIQSVGVLHGLPHLTFVSPFGLDAQANISAAWQVISTHHLRRAISNVLQLPGYANRNILFARSNIEGTHCLFGPAPWLWGYDAIPDGIPENISQWVQWLLGATPEDEVKSERIDQCNMADGDFFCRLASIGHPNISGATDYAYSIIYEMEKAGVLNTTDPACIAATRNRVASCRLATDERNYQCVRLDAAACSTCTKIVDPVVDFVKGLIKDGAGRIKNIAENMKDAAGCFSNTQSDVEHAAAGQFEAAADNFIEAGNHFGNIVDCWADTQNSFQSCDDKKASKIAECYHDYNNRVNTTCNIQCNSFKRCRHRYGKYDPRRYACLAARGACVAAAEAARAVCIAGMVTIREACILAAETEALACKGGEVIENTGCIISEGAQGIWEGVKGIGHGIAGVGLAVGAFGKNFFCALGNFAKGLGNFILGTFEVGLGLGVGLGLVPPLYLSCSLGRWITNRSCKIFNWGVGTICKLGNGALTISCLAWNLVSRTTPKLPRVP